MKTLKQRAFSPGAFAVIAAIVVLGFVFTGCRDAVLSDLTVAVTDVELNETTLTLDAEDTATLLATVNPESATNQKVTWSSSDETIATVTGDPDTGEAIVLAVAEGTATITVTTKGKKANGQAATATCEVTVNPVDPGLHTSIPVSGVTLSENEVELEEITLEKGSTKVLTATVKPANATNKNVTWLSGDPAKVAVTPHAENHFATIRAVEEGVSLITVTTADGSHKAECLVTVTPVAPDTIPVTGVTLNKLTLTLTVGNSETLVETVEPSDATNKKVSWDSDNSDVATVTNGFVTALSPGEARITVTTEDGDFEKTCIVTVTPVLVTGVEMNEEAITLEEGDTKVLTATVLPETATNKNVTWLSSDTDVATVDVHAENHVATIRALAEGEATITVTTVNGSHSAECVVTVIPVDPGTVAVTGVTLNKSALTLIMGSSETLIETVEPPDATNTNVSWDSNNTAVATVNNGTVHAHTVGTATITVTTENGGFEKTCIVTVKPVAVTFVALSQTSLTLLLNETGTLTATVNPTDATNKNVSWRSSDETKATVTVNPATGVATVTAKAEGTADIIVTTAGLKADDQPATATCAVTVKPIPVTSVTLDKTSLNVAIGSEYGETLLATVNPSTATYKTVRWESSDETKATVIFNETGNALVRGVSAGPVTITVFTVGLKADGQPATATCEVTVHSVAVTGVELSITSLTLVKDGTQDLVATVAPNNATNKKVSWLSSDPGVATVNVNPTTGIATVTGGVTIGYATISVTTEDGGHKATCAVTVHSAGVNNLAGKTYNIGGYTTTYSADLTFVVTSSGANEFKGTYTYDSTEKTLVTTNTHWRQGNGAWKTESEAFGDEKQWFPTRTFKYEITGNYVLAQQIVTNAGSDELKGKTYMRTVGVQNRPYVFSETDNTCSYTSNNQAVIAAYYYDSTKSVLWLRPITIAGKTMIENFTGSNASTINSNYESLGFEYDADPTSYNYLKITQMMFQTNW
jgi:uncharacterized protein YjdB